MNAKKKAKATTLSRRSVRSQAKRYRKLLSRALTDDEVRVVLAVWRAELLGESHRASSLGWHGSLQRRGWLVTDVEGSFRLSQSTKDLLREAGE